MISDKPLEGKKVEFVPKLRFEYKISHMFLHIDTSMFELFLIYIFHGT